MRVEFSAAKSNEWSEVCTRAVPTQQLAQALHLKATRLEVSPSWWCPPESESVALLATAASSSWSLDKCECMLSYMADSCAVCPALFECAEPQHIMAATAYP